MPTSEDRVWSDNEDQGKTMELRDKPFCAEFNRANGLSQSPAYNYLLNISSGEKYRAFILFYTFMAVKIYGENLQEVVEVFKHRKCAVLREWRSEFGAPEPGKPVVRKIEIVVKSIPDMIAESERNPEVE